MKKQPAKNRFLQGLVKRHPDGFGFFIPDDPELPDVYIPRHSMKHVMTNDKVMIEVFREQGGNRFRGEIVKITGRGTTSVVGVYRIMNESMGLIRDEGKGWGTDLKVPTKDAKDAKDGQLVSVQITSYPDDDEGFRGKVKEVIGDAMDPLTDVKRVLLSQNIPHEFSQATLNEAKQFEEHVDPADIAGRKDLRALSFITIDGATAKDFDDAIYVEQNDRGFLLYVAIADVSHYVTPGSAIDKDAYERGTSVYFPNYVVPMLPEVLSNGLCSLNPHVDRLALVAEIQMDFTGEVLETDFYEAVFESKARVTYGEAQEIIDGSDIEKLSHVKEDILRASDLAKILMAKRFKEGSLDLEIPEMEIILDSAGVPIDMIRSERLFAHRLIEEMMLAANVAVAKFFTLKEIPAIYRIHEPPNEDAIHTLERYLWNFGSQAKMEGGKLQKKLTRALQDFEGKPEGQILNILALRSMSQAKYSSNNVGHFGLGFDFYTHFTSPIRRYPDLIVHRLLKHLVANAKKYRAMGEEELQTSATMLSACEQRSVKAERQFEAIKKARFMSKFLGQEFDGIISSVTKFGVFVLLRAYEVDGLIRVDALAKEKLEFDEENLVLFNAKTGRRFSIGDPMRVKVVSADSDAGQVDFERVLPEADLEAGDDLEETDEIDPRLIRRKNKKLRQQDFRHGKKDDRQDKKRGKRPDKKSDKKFDGKKSKFDRGPKKEEQKKKEFTKSKKLQRLEKSDNKVFKFLNVPEDAPPGEKGNFDPGTHFEKVMQKWKARQGGGGEKAEKGSFKAKEGGGGKSGSKLFKKKFNNRKSR